MLALILMNQGQMVAWHEEIVAVAVVGVARVAAVGLGAGFEVGLEAGLLDGAMACGLDT